MNLKNYVGPALLWIFLQVVFYAASGFASWTWNPSEWVAAWRIVAVAWGLLTMVGCAASVEERIR